MKTKNLNWKVKVLDEQNRIIQMTGSTEDYDRIGDRMLMSGVMLTNYLKNPVVLANHNYGECTEKPTCIGKAIDVKVQESQLIFKIQFAETDNARDWFYLYANKYMNASSIGFDPIKYEPNAQGGYDYTQWELLELSLVSVPCNPNAIQNAYKSGHISKKMYETIKKKTIESEDIENMKAEEVKELITNSIKTEIKALEDKHKSEMATKLQEINELNAKIKVLKDLVSKSGAKLSQSTCDTLTKACDGILEHVKNIKALVDVVTQDTDGGLDNEDTKEYTQEDINKAVQENIKKILGGNE